MKHLFYYKNTSTQNQIENYRQEDFLSYPGIVELAPANNAYNCFSYAFYSRDYNNNYYIDRPEIYFLEHDEQLSTNIINEQAVSYVGDVGEIRKGYNMEKLKCLILIICLIFLFGCNNETTNKNNEIIENQNIDYENNSQIDEKINEENKENEVEEKEKYISDFTVDVIENLFIGYSTKLNINYDSLCDVDFQISSSNDNVEICENTILAKKEGNCKIVIVEKNSKLRKEFNLQTSYELNEYLKINNGYYLYKECVFKKQSISINRINFTYFNNAYFHLNNNLVFEEFNTDNYDKSYFVYENNINKKESILIKGNNIYLGLYTEGQNNPNILECYAIYRIEFYSVEQPENKINSLNKDMNISNGIYIAENLYGMINRNPAYMNIYYIGNPICIISDKYDYVLEDINNLLSTNFDNDFLFQRSFETYEYYLEQYKIDIDDVEKWYSCYVSGEYKYGIIICKNKDIFYLGGAKTTKSFIFSELYKIHLHNEIIVEEDYTTLGNEYFGDYLYKDFIFNENEELKNILTDSVAFTLDETILFIKNNNIIEELLDKNINERYDFIYDSLNYKKSIFISDDKIYYVVFNTDLVFDVEQEKENPIFIVEVEKGEVIKNQSISGDYLIDEALVESYDTNISSFETYININDINIIESQQNIIDLITFNLNIIYNNYDANFIKCYDIIDEFNDKILLLDEKFNLYLVYKIPYASGYNYNIAKLSKIIK